MTFFDRHKRAADWRAGKLARRQRAVSGRFEQNRYKGDRWELTHPEIDEASVARRLKPVYPLRGS